LSGVGVERRGRLIGNAIRSNRTKCPGGGEATCQARSEAVAIPKLMGLGGVAAGQANKERREWTVRISTRSRPIWRTPLQDLESDELGNWFPAGQGSGRSRSRMVVGFECGSADDRGQGRADGGAMQLEPVVEPRFILTRMAIGRGARLTMRSRPAGSGAGSTTG